MTLRDYNWPVMWHKSFWSALLFAAMSCVLLGQTASKTRLEVHVTDMTGAVVSHARVEVTSSGADVAAVGHTDSNGVVAFNVSPGNYDLMAVSRGFYFKKTSLQVLHGPAQTATALLQVDACPGPGHPGGCVMVEPFPSADRVGFIVADAAGEPISDAQIEVTNQATDVKAATDSGGWAQLELAPGVYKVLVARRIFEPRAQTIEIGTAVNQPIRITMDVDCARVTCDASVSADAPLAGHPQ